MPKGPMNDEVIVVFRGWDYFGNTSLTTFAHNLNFHDTGWVTVSYTTTDGTVHVISYPPTAFSYVKML